MKKNKKKLPVYQGAGTFQLPTDDIWNSNAQQSFRPNSLGQPPVIDPLTQNWDSVLQRYTGQANNNFANAVNTSYRPKVYDAMTGTYVDSTPTPTTSAGNTPIQPKATPSVGTTPPPTALPTSNLPLSPDFTEMENAKKLIQPTTSADFSKQGYQVSGMGYNIDPEQVKKAEDNFQQYRPQDYQLWNPYGGFDIPTAANMLGQGIESGNAFDIAASGLKLATGLGRNIVGGMGQQRRRDFVLNEAQENFRDASRPTQYYQDGGMSMGQEAPPQGDIMQEIVEALQQGVPQEQILEQLIVEGTPPQEAQQMVQSIVQQMQQEAPTMQKGGTQYKVLTGEYTAEVETEAPSVAEVEQGEYIQKPDGNITQVVGESHEKGGVELTEQQLPDNSQIISDHLRVGKDGAKVFNERYDLGINSTDTYAKILEKYNKKIGLKSIVEEQEILIKKLDKQLEKVQQNPQSESTVAINIDFLQRELAELEEKKLPLEEARKVLFDDVFNIQEAGKEGEETQTEFKNGGKNIPIYQDGTGNPLLNMYASLQNIGQNIVPEGISEAEFFQNSAKQTATRGVSGSVPTYTPEEKQLIKTHYAKFIKDPQSLQTLNNAVDKNELVFNIGMLQAIQSGKVLPIEFQSKDGSNGTYGLQDEERINGYLYKDTFKQKTGREFNPNSREDTKLIYNEVIPQLREKGVDYNGAPFRGQNTDAYGNIVASEPGFVTRGKAKKDGTIDLDKFRNQPSGTKQLIADEYGVMVNELEEEAKNSTNKFLKLTKDKPIQNNYNPTAQIPSADLYTPPTDNTTTEEEQYRKRMGIMLLPNQDPLRPESLQPALKIERRFDRVEAPLANPDQAIQEIRRSTEAAKAAAYQNLPPQQAAAVASNYDMTEQEQIGKVINQVQGQNINSTAQANQFNAQVQMQEENARATDLLSYERNILGADAKTQANLRNYYNTLQKVNTANYNTISSMNLISQANPNFAYDGQGIINTEGAYIPNYSGTTAPTNEEILRQAEAIKKARKKRFGGKVKN